MSGYETIVLEQVAAQLRVRLVTGHPRLGSAKDDFHRWYLTDDRVMADSKGRFNPRMNVANWMEMRCENPWCPAQALVYVNDLEVALPPWLVIPKGTVRSAVGEQP